MKEIYETLPDKPTAPAELKMGILEFLKKEPNKFYNVQQLCKETGFEEKDKTKPTIRLACKELLHFEKQPIASSHAGFCYATNRRILEKFKEHMQHRVQGMMRTLNDIDAVLTGAKPPEESEPAYDEVCGGGAYGSDVTHLWAKNKEPWTCIRCGAKRHKK